MKIIAAEKTISKRGPSDWFTGTVFINEIATAEAPSRLSIARVTFEPGARTAWHTHPIIQVLHVLSGVGRLQKEGEKVQLLKAGDTAVILAGEKHWHGASADCVFVHLAVQEMVDGYAADWLEQVSDADYLLPIG